MKNIVRLFSAALALMMLLAAAASAETLDGITVTYVTSPLNVPSIVEKDGAWLAENLGMNVEYAQIDSGADQTAALASGDIQILNAVGGTSVILAAANGADIKIISMYSRSPEAFMLFSADESINSPEDLAGKTIAGPKGTNLHELLAAYLATADMTIDDVNFVSMDIPSSYAALEGGSIDCALLAGAVAYNCRNSGMHLVTNGDGLIAATILTATTQEFYDAHPEIVEGFVATQEAIVAYMNENHDDAVALAAETLGLEPDAVEEMYAMYDFSPEITDDDIASLQATADFMYSNAMIETEVDASTLILER